MRLIKNIKILFYTALCVMPTISIGASFDCRKASNDAELAICNDKKLSALDTKLGRIYRSAIVKSKLTNTEESLREEQRDWLAKRDQSFLLDHNNNTIKLLYQDRINVLRCPSYNACNTEIHAVGVYRAKNDIKMPNGGWEGDIEIYVTRKKKPITLVLTSYDRVNWVIVKDDAVDIRKIIIYSYNRSSVRGNYSESTRVILTSFRDGNENDVSRIFPKSWDGFNTSPGIGNKKEISNFISDCKKSFGKIPTSFHSSTALSNIEISGTHMDIVQREDLGSAQISIQLGNEPKQLLIIDKNDDESNSLRTIPCEDQKCS